MGHIAAASGVKVVLDPHAVPVAEAAVAALGPRVALELALSGGEDYELCFVTDPGVVDVAYFAQRHGVELTRVGRVEEGEGVWIEGPDGAGAGGDRLRPLETGRAGDPPAPHLGGHRARDDLARVEDDVGRLAEEEPGLRV